MLSDGLPMNTEETCQALIGKCLEMQTDDPVKIFRVLIREGVPMYGGLHHFIVPFALITAYWHLKRDFDLEAYLREAADRAKSVPETICGYWGTCGSAVGAGIFLSVVTRTGPRTKGRRYGQCNTVVSRCLARIGEMGGPRCCKRNAAVSIITACDYVKEEMGIEMNPSTFGCTYSDGNDDCIGDRCPFRTTVHIH
jgi:hypothetical protein